MKELEGSRFARKQVAKTMENILNLNDKLIAEKLLMEKESKFPEMKRIETKIDFLQEVLKACIG